MTDRIDFDQLFRRYLKEYISEHAADEKAMQRIEDEMPEIYAAWLKEPNAALNGLAPGQAFDGHSDGELVREMLRYAGEGKDLPDLLMNAVLDRGEAMQDALVALLYESRDWETPRAILAQAAAIEALMHMLSQKAAPWYFERIEAMESCEDEVALQCAQALLLLGEAVGERLIAALENTENPLARESYADIASELRLEGALDALLLHFETEWENRGFYAFCLGRMGDARAAGALEKALRSRDLRYLDYIAIRDAYEQLGGLVEVERDFSNDPDYQALCRKNKRGRETEW